MKNAEKNIKVIAENNENKSGFSIYLDFSGQRELIVLHRYNGILYNILKDGVALRDINRKKPIRLFQDRYGRRMRRATAEFDNMMNHLRLVINDYITYREVG